MSDNFNISTADGERTIATDQIEEVDFQRIKLIHGADDTNNGDVARTNPLPVQAYLESGTIHNGADQLVPKFARVALAADGNIVAGVATKKIRVLAMTVNVDTANDDLDVEDGSGGTNLWKFANIPLGVWPLPYNPHGWFETTAGNALYGDITLAGTGVNIAVVYVEV